MSARAWRRPSAAFALPVVLASGCLLVAPPEDLPAAGTGGSGAHGGGGRAGSAGLETGGAGAVMTAGGDTGGESNPEGGGPGSGGNAGAGGSVEAGAGGGGGVGGSVGSGGKGGTGAKGGTGGSDAMGGAGEGGAPGCTTNKECVDRIHEEARCRPDHTCVQLKSEECLLVDGPYTDANALYIGSFVPYGSNPKNSDVFLAEQLAVDEINAAGGLPGGADASARPLVLVGCTNDDSSSISLGMAHLAEDVQVPAVLAMLLPDDLGNAFEQEVSRKLFFLNPGATVSTLADPTYDPNGLLWTLLGQSSDYAPAYGLLLSALEKQVRSERGLASGDQIKVALVYTTDSASKDLHFFLFRGLEFNGGASASENATAMNYKEFALDPATAPGGSVLDDLLAFEPDIVISAAGISPDVDVMTGSAGVLPRLETDWTSSKPRPFYLLSPYNGTTDAKNVLAGIVMSEVDSEPTAARRFLGVNAAPALDSSLENAFESRYYTAFPDQKASGTAPNVDNYYDAAYYLAYAMYGGDSLTGPGIANGMKRLITGTSFDDGPGADGTAIGNVFTALDGSAPISLNTTLGPSDSFDPQTGVRPVTPGVFCFTYNGSLTMRPNELRYDPSQDKFTGTYRCLDNFPPP